MSTLRDARFGLRLLGRNPGFTAVAVITLALGISATTAIFSVVYGTFFAPLPYRQAERLVMVWEHYENDRVPVSPGNYVEWRRQASAFTDLNAWGGRSVNLATADRPENLMAGLATPGFLAMLGYGHPLALGRTFTEEEGTVGRDNVVVLTYRLWQDRFGGDPGIVGRQVRIDGLPHTVVGVLGEGPADHQQNKVWLPLAFTPEALSVENHWLNVMGRLKDDVTVAGANASMVALGAALARGRPTRGPWTVSVEPFRNNFVRGSTKRGLWLLLGAVVFLLLIACANVANLLLARGSARQRELAVRTSMGATRGAIVRQLFVESLVVALAGGALGAMLSLAIVEAIVALMPPFTLPSETEIVLSIPVLMFSLAVCVGSGVLAGCAPAWQAWRSNLLESMKDGSRSVSSARHGLRRTLVILEFALALTLLSGGGMAVRALVTMMNADLGFRPERVVRFTLPVPDRRLPSPQAIEVFYRQLLDGSAALPGVASASISTGMPVWGAGYGDAFLIVGRPVSDPAQPPGAWVNMVTPAYFDTFGIRKLGGRAFTDRDRAGGARVVIVNEALARRYFPGVDPLGQRLLLVAPFPGSLEPRPEPVEWQIVGVYGDVPNSGGGWEPGPEIFVPFWQVPWAQTTMAIRTVGEAAGVQAGVASILRRLDPDLPMADVRTMDQVVSETLAPDRFYTVFFGAFAAFALLLASIGVYGVMSFVVAQRTHEIGLRMALGAGRGQVLRQVLREGMTTALIGTALGAVGALFVGRAMQGMVYGVESSDPVVFLAVALILLGAALAACLVPARRAASVDPMVALRQD